MPQNRNSTPPPVMTWGRASFVLILCVLFDILRLVFEQFWLFGPVIAAAYCSMQVSGALSTWTLGLLGAKTAAVACSVAAGVAGFASAAPLEMFGVVMEMAIGLLGWLLIGTILLVTNARILKENGLWFVASLAVSETPFIGTLPAFTLIMWRMYKNQIRIENEEFKKYQQDEAVRQRQQNAFFEARMEQVAITEAANDAAFEQAVSDEEIPEEMRNAA